MITIATNNCTRAPTNIPHKTPPSLGRPVFRLLAFARLFRAFSFSCFKFVSYFDIRISCFHTTIPNQSNLPTHTAYTAQLAHKPRPFYAKQTQFAKSQNPPNILWTQGLWKCAALRTPPKQTQFQNPPAFIKPIYVTIDFQLACKYTKRRFQ